MARWFVGLYPAKPSYSAISIEEAQSDNTSPEPKS